MTRHRDNSRILSLITEACPSNSFNSREVVDSLGLEVVRECNSNGDSPAVGMYLVPETNASTFAARSPQLLVKHVDAGGKSATSQMSVRMSVRFCALL